MSGLLGDRIMEALARNAARVEGTDGAGLDAADLCGAARGISRAVRAVAQPNEPIIIEVGNRPADLAGFLGIWLAGCVAVPIHVTAAKPTLDALLASTKTRLLLRDGQLDKLCTPAPPERPLLEGAALIIFTSGSTGVPKGVVIGHAGLSWKLDVLSRLLGLRPSDGVLMPLQLTFIFGIWVSLLTLLAGARLIVMPKFSRDLVSEPLQRATVLAAVPTMLRALCPGAVAPVLRMVLTGGEPFAPALADAVAQAMPSAGVFDLFGLTETGSCDFCVAPVDQQYCRGSIGRATDGVEFRLVPQAGSATEGAGGESQIKTPARMLGYLDEPAMTTAAFDAGFFKTGDLARQRGDGMIELIGRAKEIISRGGNKISPIEIDNLFLRHDDVAAAMAVSLADPLRGEALHVLVVAKDNRPLDAGALRVWVSTRTEKYKVPDGIHVCEALPIGKTGKASRAEARAVVQRLLVRQ